MTTSSPGRASCVVSFVEKRYEDIVNALYSDNDIVHIDTTIKYEDGRESNIRTDMTIRKITRT